MIVPTDKGVERDESYFARGVLAQERAADTLYSVKAWAHGLAWTSLLAAVGLACTAAAQRDWVALSAALTAIVAVFLPSLNPRIVYEVIKTSLIATGRIPQPPGELPIVPPPAKGAR